jgi:DNA modification methylase
VTDLPTDTTPRIVNAAVLDALRSLPAASVQCMVSSFPYWSKRDYGVCGCALRRNVSSGLAEIGGNLTDGSAGQLSTDDARCRREPDPNCPDCHGSGRIAMDSVWGEPAEPCEHQWATTFRYWDNRHASVLAAEGADGLGSHADARGKVPSTTCARCGAWRGAFGLEPTVDLFVAHAVEVGRELRRVLRPDGVLWLNLGDSYAGSGKGPEGNLRADQRPEASSAGLARALPAGLKPKDLVGVPWRVAFAYQADGWCLRADNVWAKPNPMPESARDRPAVSHEYVFLFAKSVTTQFWTHRDLPGTRSRPHHDYRWVDRLTDTEYAERPEGYAKGLIECPDCGGTGEADDWPPTCPTCEGRGRVRRWARVNLWTGHDYFYDPDAVRVPLAPTTLQRAQSHYPNAVDNPDTASKFGPGDRRAYPVVTAAMRDAASLARATGLARSTAQEVLDGYAGHATKSFAGTGAQDASAVKRRIIEGKRRRLARTGYFYVQDPTISGAPRSGFRMAQPRGGESSMVPSKATKDGGWNELPRLANALGANLKTVWWIPTQPYPAAHFATFPEELVSRCVLAGTSAAGSCAICGAPWARAVEAEGGTIGRDWHPDKGLVLGRSGQGSPEGASDGSYRRVDLGFRPTCEHVDAPRVPCVVLDPFVGSGTTCFVARRLERRSVGIELNPVYVRLARDRVGRCRDLLSYAPPEDAKAAASPEGAESGSGSRAGGASVQAGPPPDPSGAASL